MNITTVIDSLKYSIRVDTSDSSRRYCLEDLCKVLGLKDRQKALRRIRNKHEGHIYYQVDNEVLTFLTYDQMCYLVSNRRDRAKKRYFKDIWLDQLLKEIW